MRARRLLPALLLALQGVAPVTAQAPLPRPVQVVDPGVRVRSVEAELAEAEERLAADETRAARIEAELAALATRREAKEAQLRTRVRALYRLRRAGLLPVSGGFTAMLTHLSRLERLARIVRDDARAARFMARREDALREEARTLSAAIRRATERRSQAESRRQALEAELGGFGAAGAEYAPALPVAPLPPAPSFGAGMVGAEPGLADVSAFTRFRGRLGAPVASATGVREAVRDDGPGLEFLAPVGTPVRAVADGRVAFAGTYGSYGRVVIVDHGDSYYTVYGGLGRVVARVGDPIARGAQIGDVGGASTPSIFFEVRAGTRTLDARQWTGL